MTAALPPHSSRYRCPVTGRVVTLDMNGARLRTPMVLAPRGRRNPQLTALIPPGRDAELVAACDGKVFGEGCVVGRGLLAKRWWPYLVPAHPGSYTADQVVVNQPLPPAPAGRRPTALR